MPVLTICFTKNYVEKSCYHVMKVREDLKVDSVIWRSSASRDKSFDEKCERKMGQFCISRASSPGVMCGSGDT